ncbi:5'-deoxynucleotidase [Olsenella sp. An285]|uniref:5'-deoxynucleotidase n=1 Tax=Olsenella sp. An285 TaxID=1965621 RepID=UPI000B37C232|nr:5'-deoxynucleotidase [Olsenella sp. An285]OUO48087.1 5'-deoxynucleotidase [Olsenella sp. An285]
MAESQESHFLALLSRMKYIERWALMRSSRPENLSEHSLEVASIAHMLCVIGNARFGRSLDAERAALVAIYHDASEIITGDMPTPVKYHDGTIRDAYRAVEKNAEERLLAALPDDLRPAFEDVFWPSDDASEDERYLRRLVKAADKISALIKCVDESRAGNAEFTSAESTCRAAVDEMAAELPEVADFVREFLPSFGATLDELL